MMIKSKGQSIIEYCFMAALIIFATIVMGPYVVRAINAHFKLWQESIEDTVNDRMTPVPLNIVAPQCTCSNTWTDGGCGGTYQRSNYSCPPDSRYQYKACFPPSCGVGTGFDERCNPDPSCCNIYNACSSTYPTASCCGTAPIPDPSNPRTTTDPKGLDAIGNDPNDSTKSCYFGEELLYNQCNPDVRCRPNPQCMPGCIGNLPRNKGGDPLAEFCPGATDHLTQDTSIRVIGASNINTNNCVTFSTPGTYTWTTPPEFKNAKISVWGAGGGGGGSPGFDSFGASGGGAGGYGETTLSLQEGSIHTIVVGRGGNPAQVLSSSTCPWQYVNITDSTTNPVKYNTNIDGGESSFDDHIANGGQHGHVPKAIALASAKCPNKSAITYDSFTVGTYGVLGGIGGDTNNNFDLTVPGGTGQQGPGAAYTGGKGGDASHGGIGGKGVLGGAGLPGASPGGGGAGGGDYNRAGLADLPGGAGADGMVKICPIPELINCPTYCGTNGNTSNCDANAPKCLARCKAGYTAEMGYNNTVICTCAPTVLSSNNVILDADADTTMNYMSDIYSKPINFNIKVHSEDLSFTIKFFDDKGVLKHEETCTEAGTETNVIESNLKNSCGQDGSDDLDTYETDYVANQVSVQVHEGGHASTESMGYVVTGSSPECVATMSKSIPPSACAFTGTYYGLFYSSSPVAADNPINLAISCSGNALGGICKKDYTTRGIASSQDCVGTNPNGVYCNWSGNQLFYSYDNDRAGMSSKFFTISCGNNLVQGVWKDDHTADSNVSGCNFSGDAYYTDTGNGVDIHFVCADNRLTNVTYSN